MQLFDTKCKKLYFNYSNLPHFCQWVPYTEMNIQYLPNKLLQVQQPKFIVLDLGVQLTPAQGCRTGPPTFFPGGPVRQPYARVDFIPQSGTKNFATEGKWCRIASKLTRQFKKHIFSNQILLLFCPIYFMSQTYCTFVTTLLI